jgi:hypothetical protein
MSLSNLTVPRDHARAKTLTFAVFSFETRSLPTLAHCLPRSFALIHSHCPVLAPATLAALPSTRAIPDRDLFYVALPFAPLTRFIPKLTRWRLFPFIY